MAHIWHTSYEDYENNLKNFISWWYDNKMKKIFLIFFLIFFLIPSLSFAKKGIWKETMASMTQILLYPDYEVIHVDSYIDSNSSYNEKIVYTIRGPHEAILCYIYKYGFEITSNCYYETD